LDNKLNNMKKDFWQWSRPFWAAFFVQPFSFLSFPQEKSQKTMRNVLRGGDTSDKIIICRGRFFGRQGRQNEAEQK
jgi:hypothetical protein